MVTQAYATVGPNAMVIHNKRALLTNAAVMCAQGFKVFTFGTMELSDIMYSIIT